MGLLECSNLVLAMMTQSMLAYFLRNFVSGYKFLLIFFINVSILFYSIEDDFITWKDKFWPAVCEKFNIESTGEEELTRQFRLVTHAPGEIQPNNVFTGEIARLHSLQVQRPLVTN